MKAALAAVRQLFASPLGQLDLLLALAVAALNVAAGFSLAGSDSEPGQPADRAADDEPSPAFLEITGDSTQDLLTKLLGFPDLRAIEFVPTRKPRPRSTVPAALARSTYRIKVDLQHVRPPVWRRLLVSPR